MNQEQNNHNYFQESPKERVARLFEEDQQAKTKEENRMIWVEWQKIYS